jgi:hypothetical protein
MLLAKKQRMHISLVHKSKTIDSGGAEETFSGSPS